MLMKPDAKKAATLILASGKAPVVNEQEGAEQEMNPSDLAAEEILAAISAGDAKALSEALKAHYEMRDNEPDSAPDAE